MLTDEQYMRMAVDLAWKGIGRHSPNPMVGCVIVNHGEVIGEGYHLYDKIKHAEILALEMAGERAKGSTAYVTVEPCCHHGRTGPCTDALIKAGVSKVVYGMNDPDPRVCGNGCTTLKDSGMEVISGILEDEIRQQNKFFVTAKEKDRPYIFLKWAMTLDGKIATRSGNSKWISGEDSRRIVHHLRNIYQGILVGHNTVLVDDPMLTCRLDANAPPPQAEIYPAVPEDVRNPVRIIADTLGATGGMPHLNIFNEPGTTIIAMAPENDWDDPRARDSIDENATEIIKCPVKTGHIDLTHLMRELVNKNIHSVLVEGGAGIHAAFLQNGLADEILVTIGPKVFAGDGAPSPVAGVGVEMVSDAWELDNVKHLSVGSDVIITGNIVYSETGGREEGEVI